MPCSFPSRSRALRQFSTHGDIVVGAQTLFSSIQCNLPLKFASQFWGALHFVASSTANPLPAMTPFRAFRAPGHLVHIAAQIESSYRFAWIYFPSDMACPQ